MMPENFTRIGVTVREPAYPFSKIPAFGFETKSIRATEKTAELANKLYNKFAQRSNPYLKAGFEKRVQKAGGRDAYKASLEKSIYKESNRSKIAGYIPVIGTFVGLGRIYSVATNREIYSKREFLRAAIESLSLGIFLIPVDIGVTIHRKRQWKKALAELQQ